MNDSFAKFLPSAKLVEMNYLMSEKIDIFNKIVNNVKKTGACFTAIIVNTNNIDPSSQTCFTGTLVMDSYFYLNCILTSCSKGNGYELIKMKSAKPQGADSYPLVFSYPKLTKENYAKHVLNIISSVKHDIKPKYFNDSVILFYLLMAAYGSPIR